MKEIKEWEWDFRRLSIHHNWYIDNEDYDFGFQFKLVELGISIGCITITLFNFGICYEWDK